jgi:hypothetical protein
MIKRCPVCEDYRTGGAVYQNKIYGHGMRVFTPMQPNNGIPQARCTVCGHVWQASRNESSE